MDYDSSFGIQAIVSGCITSEGEEIENPAAEEWLEECNRSAEGLYYGDVSPEVRKLLESDQSTE